jgi:hypothetical protein
MVERLAEGLDRLKRLVPAGSRPVLAQLVEVGTRPLDHEPSGPRRKLTGEDLEALDVDRLSEIRRVDAIAVRSASLLALA